MNPIRLLLSAALLALLPLGFARAAETYSIDPVHSSISFKVRHLGVSNVAGRFETVGGTFTYDEADPAKIAISLKIETGTVSTNNPDRDKHLKSPDFFNVAQFPAITFTSTSVKVGTKAATDDGTPYDITGDLSFNGVTKSVTLPVRFLGTGKGMKGETRAGGEAQFTIKRSDYGMKGFLPAVGDDVAVTVEIEGVQQ